MFFNLKPEVYVPMVEFEGYQISNYGNVRRLTENGYIQVNIYITAQGYCAVSIKGKGYLIHRLVAKYFCSNPFNLDVVNHIDGNRQNNYFENLQWCTHAFNNAYRVVTGTDPRGEKCPVAKLTEEQVLEIYDLAHNSNMTQNEIAKIYDIDRKTVSDIKLGISWNHLTKHKLIPIISYTNKERYIVERTTGRLRGEDIPTGKLTEEQVLEIYDLAHNSNMTQKEIAKMFNICRQSVSDIKLGKTWGFLTGHNKE